MTPLKPTQRKIRVLCVDDSALMRTLMTRIVDGQPDMQMVGAAPDPLIARQMIKDLNPDVLTLDVEMPKMDGLDFLGRLMRLRPMPVIMVSSLTSKHSEYSLRALELGAMDVVGKPTANLSDGMMNYADQIADKIRAASLAKFPAVHLKSPPIAPAVSGAFTRNAHHGLIAIGASTGGTEAITTVLRSLPSNAPPIVMTQHMPAGFTRTFVDRLDRLCQVRVHEASHGQPIQPGHAYLAPGGVAHLAVKHINGTLYTQLIDSDPVNRHRPSVDVLLNSVAEAMGHRATGVVLTGMGKDGARGLLAMREKGADTFVQDEASCVVFGMPKEAVAIGATIEQVSLHLIAQRLLSGPTK